MTKKNKNRLDINNTSNDFKVNAHIVNVVSNNPIIGSNIRNVF